MKFARIVPLFLGLTLLALAASAQAESYRDNAAKFTIEIPKGWRAMPADRLDAINQEAGKFGGGIKIEYSAGFESTVQDPTLPSYILIQSNNQEPLSGSYDEIEKAIQLGMKIGIKQARDAMGDAIGDIKAGEAKLDRSKNRYAARNVMQLPGVGNLGVLTIGMLGSQRVVFVHCYALEDRFAQMTPSFTAFADGFRYDAGQEFTPSAPGTGNRFWRGVMGKAVIGGFIGGIIGLIAWGVKKFTGGPRPQPRDEWPTTSA